MDIKNLIRVYENALDEQFCDKIIRQFKRDRKLQTGPGGQKLGDTYIGNPGSKWTELRIDDLAKWDPIRQKLVESCQVHCQKYINNVEGYLPQQSRRDARDPATFLRRPDRNATSDPPW